MISTSNSLRHAIHCVLLASAATTLCAVPALAQETDASARPIEEVVITGSRIRRVDEETASPVFVLDAGTIANTGVSTLGDLMMRVPAISGAATNPQVNNGGGTGESNVELRGLGAQRTLVLLNGRRINILGANGTTSAVDINMIPLNMIERVEVLKEGAGAVYGSDAIAGVVNFITKKNLDGADVNVEWGQTGESDGERQSASLTLGSTGEKLSVIFGANYNKQEAVSAADREFSANALYLYGGAVTAAVRAARRAAASACSTTLITRIRMAIRSRCQARSPLCSRAVPWHGQPQRRRHRRLGRPRQLSLLLGAPTRTTISRSTC